MVPTLNTEISWNSMCTWSRGSAGWSLEGWLLVESCVLGTEWVSALCLERGSAGEAGRPPALPLSTPDYAVAALLMCRDSPGTPGRIWSDLSEDSGAPLAHLHKIQTDKPTESREKRRLNMITVNLEKLTFISFNMLKCLVIWWLQVQTCSERRLVRLEIITKMIK